MNKLTPLLKHAWHTFSCGCSEFVIKHKNLTEHDEDKIYYECLKCNYETEGWFPDVRRSNTVGTVDSNNIHA